jgi:hypothetical protein
MRVVFLQICSSLTCSVHQIRKVSGNSYTIYKAELLYAIYISSYNDKTPIYFV